ncbi:MAG: hypothetical protein QXV06_07255 [Ignisphaera sp.]
MIKLGVIKVLTGSIKNTLSIAKKSINKSKIVEKTRKTEEITSFIKHNVKDTLCIITMLEPSCYEIYEDGYIKEII